MPTLRSSLNRMPRPLRRLLSWGATIVLLAALAVLLTRPNRVLLALSGTAGPLAGAVPPPKLVVDGNLKQTLESSDLNRLLNLPPGSRLAGIDLSGLRDRLDALPFTSSTVLERRYPSTLVVRLDERKPVAVWQNNDRFALIDSAGEVVGYAGGPDRVIDPNLDLPLVVGTGAAAAAPDLLAALKAAPAIQAALSAAVRIGDRRWDLVLKSGCTIQLPEGDAPGALNRLQALETRDKLLERPIRVIDARMPGRLVLRVDPPKPPPPTDPKAAAPDANRDLSPDRDTHGH